MNDGLRHALARSDVRCPERRRDAQKCAIENDQSRLLSRNQLLRLSRLHDDEFYDRSIDVQVGRLRKKLAREAAPTQLIRTERGAGYVFTPRVESVR